MAAQDDQEDAWGLDWDLPAYPQLPRMFTSAKAAKKRRHREAFVSEEDLQRVVRLPRSPAAAAAAAAGGGDDSRQQHQHHQASKAAGDAPHAEGAAGLAAAPKLSKAERKQQKKRMAAAAELQQQQQQQPQAGHADSTLEAHKDKHKKKHKAEPLELKQQQLPKKQKQQQQQPGSATPDPAAAAAAAAGGGPAPAAAAAAAAAQQQLPKKSKRNKFKVAELVAQQQQQQQQDQGNQPQLRPPGQQGAQQQQQKVSKQSKKKDQAAQQQPHKQQKKRQREAAAGAAAPGAAAGGRSLLGAAAAASLSSSLAPAGGSGSKLLQQFKERLQGSRFRQLNEALYSQPGSASFTSMQAQPALFEAYHQGFQQQVKAWPQQPLDAAIAWLRGREPSLVVADFGCGEARLAASVRQTVHSLDLVAAGPGVIACNMACTPLGTASCDVAVFSLALMGTDYGAFLEEAARVIRPGGWLWVAEVRSRFARSSGGGGGAPVEDFGPFLAALRALGFKLVEQDASNTMFVVWVLRKAGKQQQQQQSSAGRGIAWPPLRACVYKKR